jgi:uncharacterized membrane-anchored protein YhcB (DUF1043 family)
MANWIGAVVGIIGVVITCIALRFAIDERRQRIKVETVVRNTLRRLAGDIKVVFENANWAELHFRNSGNLFAEDTPDLAKIKRQVVDGSRDATACARQLSLIHSQIRGIQQSLFNDFEEIFPETQADDVKAARSSASLS